VTSDVLLADHGHSVLRLPPYYPDVSPIELKRASVKQYVARKNVSLRVDDTVKMAEEKYNIITQEDWSSRCNNASGITCDLYLLLRAFQNK
jgi:transposase